MLRHACEVVLLPPLVTDCAVNRVAISSYLGPRAPAMSVLVAVAAQLIVVFSLALIDLVLFGSTVMAVCGIYTLAF